MLKRIFASLLGCSAVIASGVWPSHAPAQTRPTAGMMRFPDVSKDRIVFAYADDLWTVPREGGVASPLASPSGPELLPRFSPDGSAIAFVGNYDGLRDIYTIPAAGGMAERLTYHPADEFLCDWHPDGNSLIYSSNALSGLERQPHLMTVSLKAHGSTQLPVPYGTNGAISADGQWLAYTPHSHDWRTWKRYRGGMASDIWLFHLKNGAARQITDFEGTDSQPMWSGNWIYYLSDAGDEHRLNIWAFNPETSERKQVSKFDAYDCKWPSIGPGPDGQGEIVLQNGSHLYLLNLATGESKTVDVTIPGDRHRLRPTKVDASDFISSLGLSPHGKRVAAEARGDIWSLPAQKGSPRNLTRTSGVAERDPSWSPDGKWIAYLSDASGEYELHLTQSDGRGTNRTLTTDGKCFRYSPRWSPDSKYLTFTDKTGGLFLHAIDSGETKLIETDPYARQIEPNWSHNSQWLVYALQSNDVSPTSSLWVYQVKDGTKRRLTSGYFSDSNPVFDRKGEFVFFTSNRSFRSPQYEDLGTSFIYSGTEVLMAMPLRNDVKYPLSPRSDEESWKDEKKEKKEKEGEGDSSDEKKESEAGKDAAKPADDGQPPADKENGDQKPEDGDKESEKSDKGDADKPADESQDASDDSHDKDAKPESKEGKDDKGKPSEKSKEPKEFTIDFEEIESRAFQLPVGHGSFGNLAVNDRNQLIYSEFPRGGMFSEGGPGGGSIQLYDLHEEDPKPKAVVEGGGQFALSSDGKKLLIRRGPRGSFVVDAAPGQKLDKPIVTRGMAVVIDPRQEWKQLFHEAWRVERDFFYDPNMHGVDWKKVRDQYEAMLADCASRRDVSFVIGEMISELNVGHAYYQEGPAADEPNGNVGLLGCRFEAEGDAYKIAELYEGAPWDVDARNPLRLAGVKPGQYVLAVNEVPVTTQQDPYAYFQGLAGMTILLTVSDDAKLDPEDRQVVIDAMPNDSELRFRAWIEKNRKYVDEKTQGAVGYIYVVNTGVPGQNDLVRQYYAQLNKKALIIDDRWNGGGQIPTRFIEMLNRPATNFWAVRDGHDWTWPPDAHHGPKCMLINGMAGSGGDMFPALFRQAGLGKLFGMRTWGGLVGISGNPGLIDGSTVTAPTFAYYELDGTWGVEGHGVDPDVRVVDDPAELAKGADPQLDAAIAHLQQELRDHPFQPAARPAYPDRSKFGIAPSDK